MGLSVIRLSFDESSSTRSTHWRCRLAGMKKLGFGAGIAVGAGAALLGMFALMSTSIGGKLLSKPVEAQDWAKAKVDASPRHREYVKVTHDGRTINTFITYPMTTGKAPVIVLIHEIFGQSDWTREMADDLAAQGYIAVLPD